MPLGLGLNRDGLRQAQTHTGLITRSTKMSGNRTSIQLPFENQSCRRMPFENWSVFSIILTVSDVSGFIKIFSVCCIFLPVFGFCAPQTLVEICFFQVFIAKKLKKQEKARNLLQNLAKNIMQGSDFVKEV